MTRIGADRATRHAARSVLRPIDDVIDPRLAQLDAEWELDRTIESDAPSWARLTTCWPAAWPILTSNGPSSASGTDDGRTGAAGTVSSYCYRQGLVRTVSSDSVSQNFDGELVAVAINEFDRRPVQPGLVASLELNGQQPGIGLAAVRRSGVGRMPQDLARQ